MKKLFVSILYVLLGVGSVSAQISLDSCRTWARDNFPLSQQYDLVARSEAFSISNASRMWLPRVVISAQGTWQSEAMSLSDVFDASTLPPFIAGMFDIPDLYMRQLQGKVQMELQQTLWDGGASAAQKQITRSESSVQTAQADVDMQQLESRVDQIFFAILLLREQQGQMESMESLLQSNLERARSLASNDIILPGDADAVEAELLSAQQRLSQIRYGLSAYGRMLSLLCGREIDGTQLESPAFSSDRKVRPEEALFESQLSLLGAKEKMLNASAMPQVGAFAQGWYGYPRLNMFESMKNSRWGLSAIVGLSMRWNIASFYTLKNERQRLAVARDQVAMQKEVFAFNERLRSTQDDSELSRLREAVSSDERIVALRTSVRKAAEAQFDNGTITTSELLQKVNDETQAAITLALHKIELQRKLSELFKI